MLKKVADVVRGLSADAVEQANSGHPGMPIGCADIGALLYGETMNYDPTKPNWPNRDRFILSAGHGSMLLYALLHLSGYNLSLNDLKEFRQLNSKTPGHPEYGHTPGVETTTGPLGQGFANAVGMAVTERMLAERYNTSDFDIIDHYTYTLLGDGCMMEGIVSEAASLAGHLGLGKLIAIYDSNQISIAGKTDLTFTESVGDRFKAYNWQVIEDVDGHDITEVREAIKKGKEKSDKPTLIVANTHIAYGAPNKQDSSTAHGAPLGEEEIKGLKENIGLDASEKFYVSEEVKDFFDDRRKELKKKRKNWEEKFQKWAKANPKLKEKWDDGYNLNYPLDIEENIRNLKIETPIATRKASGTILRRIADEIPYLIGGSADLAPSNKTYLDKYDEIQQGKFSGRNFRFGVREHAMGAIANGISIHGGLRPFVATFLVFSDYLRPAIRMAALMKQPVIYVFTHDSIYIGEDGPTHQPVEQLESLRLIPNLEVIRPADDEETKVAWLEAIKRQDGPTALILTRQNLPRLKKDTSINQCHRGGYVIQQQSNPDVLLIASGSEVSLAMEVAQLLENQAKRARVVSVPNREKFMKQEENYIDKVLGSGNILRVVLEAGVVQGWHQLLATNYEIISVEEFGISGPGEEVGKVLGFEAEQITNQIIDKL